MQPPPDPKTLILDALLHGLVLGSVVLFGLTALTTTHGRTRDICVETIALELMAYSVYRLVLWLLDRWYDRTVARIERRRDGRA